MYSTGIRYHYPMTLYVGKDILAELKKDNYFYFDKEIFNKHKMGRNHKLFFGLDDDFRVKYDKFYNKFIIKRYGTVGRADERIFLNLLGYKKSPIDKFEVVRMTNAKIAHDEYWIDFGEGEHFYGIEDIGWWGNK